MSSHLTTAAKWCNYCQKHGHNDAECWCTRAVEPPTHRSAMLWPQGMKPPPLTETEIRRIVREEIAAMAFSKQATKEPKP